MLDIIIKDQLDVEWCDSIVWLTRKDAIPSQSKVVGVKYKEVAGDRGAALKLAIKRYVGEEDV
jgi:hypothetical protein